MADLTSLHVDRASLGVTDTLVPTSPLRLGTLAAPAVGAPRLAVDAAGNVTAGVLAPGDLPSVFTRRDVAETISADWTWASGAVVAFATGPLAAPAATSRSLGSRLILEPVAGSTEYAVGRETAALWTSTPLAAAHKWYTGATERLRLDSNGTLSVINGTGGLYLAAAGTTDGAVVGQGSLQVRAGTGGITLQTGLGQILPTLAYVENLGAINRKFLSLHAAELWVETLVAASTMATIGGRLLIGPTTQLTRDAAPGDTTIYVKHNSLKLYVVGVEHGSKCVLEAAGKFEVVTVNQTTAPVVTAQGDYPYVVIRDHDGSGANQWYAGDAVFDTGKLGDGFIDLYSVRGVVPGTSAGPTIVGNVRTGQNAADWREHWAVGNLKGVYGNTSTKMGAAFGDTQGLHIQIDSTDGLRMLGGGGTSGFGYGQWATNGNVYLGYATAGQLLFTAADGTLRFKYAGVDRMALHSDGTLRLATQLICGGWTADPVSVRSYFATAYNSGTGFYFSFDPATNATTALIGDSTGRRVQWDNLSLKIVSDGFVLDEAGIQLAATTGGAVDVGRSIRWGSTTTLWDTTASGDARFELQRASGKVLILATESGGSGISLQAGGSGVDRVTVELKSILSGPSEVRFSGAALGGGFPCVVVPRDDYGADLGTTAKHWRFTRTLHLYSGAVMIGATVSSPGSYLLELSLDSAVKPTSSSWSILPSDRAAKDEIVAVDPDDALALVRRVPLVRYRYNGTLGGPAGVRGIGVVAQDVAPILPASITRDPDGRLAWNAHELFTLNVAAVQALAARVDALERRKDETR